MLQADKPGKKWGRGAFGDLRNHWKSCFCVSDSRHKRVSAWSQECLRMHTHSARKLLCNAGTISHGGRESEMRTPQSTTKAYQLGQKPSRCQWEHPSFRPKSYHSRIWLLLGNSAPPPPPLASQSPGLPPWRRVNNIAASFVLPNLHPWEGRQPPLCLGQPQPCESWPGERSQHKRVRNSRGQAACL